MALFPIERDGYDFLFLDLLQIDVFRHVPRDKELEFGDVMKFSQSTRLMADWWSDLETTLRASEYIESPHVPDVSLWASGAHALYQKGYLVLREWLSRYRELLPVTVMNNLEAHWTSIVERKRMLLLNGSSGRVLRICLSSLLSKRIMILQSSKPISIIVRFSMVVMGLRLLLRNLVFKVLDSSSVAELLTLRFNHLSLRPTLRCCWSCQSNRALVGPRGDS